MASCITWLLATEAQERTELEAALATTELAPGLQSLPGLAAFQAATGQPHLILLSLAEGGAALHQVMARCNASASLQPVPVVVFTRSMCKVEIREAYRAGVASVIRLPAGTDAMAPVMATLANYWLHVSPLPQHNPLGT